MLFRECKNRVQMQQQLDRECAPLAENHEAVMAVEAAREDQRREKRMFGKQAERPLGKFNVDVQGGWEQP